jgi:long-chain fatty acid transport protein
VHSPQKFVIDTGVSAELPAGNQSSMHERAVHSYLPWTFGVGAAADVGSVGKHSFAVVGDLRYALWSNYVDRHGDSPSVEGSAFAWRDVFAATLGVRHQVGPLRTFMDVNYQPTPVPPSTGRKNYVDNDRVGLIVGSDYGFEIGTHSFRVGAQLQAQRLIYRHQTKDDSLLVDELPDDAVDSRTGKPVPGAAGLQTNNPGWPGFASEGWILGGAVTASLLY